MNQTGIFKGNWISDPEFAEIQPKNIYHKQYAPMQDDRPHPEEMKNIHTLFHCSFLIKKHPGRYLFRFSADDYAKVYINGIFVGQGPATGYIEAYHYNEIDITDKLHDGVNDIIAHVYYQGCINRVWISGDFREGFIADLIDPESKVILCTDENWEYTRINNYTCRRMVGYSTAYLEDYDSRIPLPAYQKAEIRRYDDIVFRPDPVPMLQIYDIVPQHSESLTNGGVFYDFGHEITGTLNIRAAGKDGDIIRILCGEETDDSDVKVRFNMRCNCCYEEFWTLKDGENMLEQFDYKAFRYVTLIPIGSVEIGGLSIAVRHAPFDDNACLLETENKVLKSIFEICKNGVKYGTQEVYVDCPSREKGQYAGDMTVTSGAQLLLTGNSFMLEKAIKDQAQSAMICPGLMAVMSGSEMQEIADYSLQFPLLLLRHYGFTGNKEFLSSMLPVAENMIAHFEQYRREDGLLDGVADKWNLVDWPQNLRDGYDFPMTQPIGTGVHNVINAFYVGAVKNIEEIKDILGISHDDKGKWLADAFNKALFRPENGLYVDSETSTHSSVHSNMLAAFYGFVPEGYEKSVGDFLVRKKLVCGVYMSYFLLRGLCRLGRYEDVYDLIASEDENSWYNMVREGATTCFEAWGKNKKSNTSLCHPWASTPVIILIEELMNVALDGTIGEPRLPKKAGKVKMTIPTAKGSVTVTANG